MKQTFDDYCREVLVRANEAAQLEEARRRWDHLESFNFGRTVQRIQGLRYGGWLRLRWLLIGIAIGVACSSAYPRYLYSAIAHKLHTQANPIAQADSTPRFSKAATARK